MEVGYKVRVIERVGGHEFELGGVGQISRIIDDDTIVVKGVDDFWWCRRVELGIVTQDEPITAVNRPEDQWGD